MDEEEIREALGRLHPHWGYELTGTSAALGGQFSPLQQGTTAKGISFEAEYEPDWFQATHLGMLSYGISGAILPVADDLGNSGSLKTPSFLSTWTAGAQVRYQGRWIPNQFLVPMLSYSVEMLAYNFSNIPQVNGLNGPKGFVPIQGPTAGLWFLLNTVSSTEAASMYANTGFSRSYLVAEARALVGSNGDVAVSGPSVFIGFRIER